MSLDEPLDLASFPDLSSNAESSQHTAEEVLRLYVTLRHRVCRTLLPLVDEAYHIELELHEKEEECKVLRKDYQQLRSQFESLRRLNEAHVEHILEGPLCSSPLCHVVPSTTEGEASKVPGQSRRGSPDGFLAEPAVNETFEEAEPTEPPEEATFKSLLASEQDLTAVKEAHQDMISSLREQTHSNSTLISRNTELEALNGEITARNHELERSICVLETQLENSVRTFDSTPDTQSLRDNIVIPPPTKPTDPSRWMTMALGLFLGVVCIVLACIYWQSYQSDSTLQQVLDIIQTQLYGCQSDLQHLQQQSHNELQACFGNLSSVQEMLHTCTSSSEVSHYQKQDLAAKVGVLENVIEQRVHCPLINLG